MNPLSLMNGEATKELSALVTCWLVPLFILFNIAGWVGLPQREADRSRPRPGFDETADLGKAIWSAWLVGILASLALIWLIFTFCEPSLRGHSSAAFWVIVCGIAGVVLGIARGVLPRVARFRSADALTRRRILSSLVICDVAFSILCGVLYYDSSTMLQNLVASFYAFMLIGYTATYVFEVGK